MLGLFRVEEADVDQGLFQVLVEQLQFIHGRQLATAHRRHLELLHLRRLAFGCQPGHAHLVGQHLHRRRQIQRTEIGIGGDVHMKMATLQLFVGQAGVLTTKHQGDLFTLDGMLDDFAAAFARVDQRPGDAALTGTGAKHQIATDQRLVEGGNHLGATEHIIGTRRTGIGLMRRKILRVDQHQARQAHVFHGTRSAADIAGVAGIDQNNTNILQQGERSQTLRRGSKSYRSDRLYATKANVTLLRAKFSARMFGFL
ncbi:hypothetical protein D9M71_374030 [compost metagenome]